MTSHGSAPSVIDHLRQAHAAERAQLGELRVLRDECGLPAVAALLDQHLAATQAHGDRLDERLHELGSSGSLRLLAQTVGGGFAKGVVNRLRPDDPCACLRDAIAAEAGEIGSYLLLEAEALRLGDESTAVLAREIRVEEEAARDELMTFWHQAVGRQLDLAPADEHHAARAALVNHLEDVHALVNNATIMLGTVLATVRDDLATARVNDHREATKRHVEELSVRLGELHARPSSRKLAQGIAFGVVKSPINLVRRERAAKDLRDMYVVQHLELAAYAQLAALAEAAGDERTAALAAEHAAEERAMTRWLEREAARFLLETMEHASRA